MPAIHLTQESFLKKVWDFKKDPSEWHFKGDKPAIIDFFATWCGPCKLLSPILDELSEEYAGRIDIYKIDTGQENELADTFRIRSIPTLLFCPVNGTPSMTQGTLPKQSLKEIIEKELIG